MNSVLVLLIALVMVAGAAAGQTAPVSGNPTPGVIDGAQNPAAIPDIVAYLMLFRTLADRREGLTYEQRADSLNTTDLDSKAVERIILAANEFEVKSAPLDRRAERNWRKALPNPTPNDIKHLNALQMEREELIQSIVESLKDDLGPSASEKLQAYIDSTVKPNIKLQPNQMQP